MGSIKMGIGFGLWQRGLPDVATLFAYINRAEAWGIDSVWLSDHTLGERPEISIVPMMAAIAARTQRLKVGPGDHGGWYVSGQKRGRHIRCAPQATGLYDR